MTKNRSKEPGRQDLTYSFHHVLALRAFRELWRRDCPETDDKKATNPWRAAEAEPLVSGALIMTVRATRHSQVHVRPAFSS